MRGTLAAAWAPQVGHTILRFSVRNVFLDNIPYTSPPNKKMEETLNEKTVVYPFKVIFQTVFPESCTHSIPAIPPSHICEGAFCCKIWIWFLVMLLHIILHVLGSNCEGIIFLFILWLLLLLLVLTKIHGAADQNLIYPLIWSIINHCNISGKHSKKETWEPYAPKST